MMPLTATSSSKSPFELPTSASHAQSLGRHMRTWRMLNRVKQLHAAELLAVSQTTISRIEQGIQQPTPREQEAIRKLLSARLTSAADHELARLISTSSTAVHAVCDMTHQLLAASEPRQAEFRVPLSCLLGKSLWRFATPELEAIEECLPELGWYDDGPSSIDVKTSGKEFEEIVVPDGAFRYIRFRLSDGGSVRIIHTTSYTNRADAAQQQCKRRA